jgi:hypothetical protein
LLRNLRDVPRLFYRFWGKLQRVLRNINVMADHSSNHNQPAETAFKAPQAIERLHVAFERLEHAVRRSILREARATMDAINAPETIMKLSPADALTEAREPLIPAPGEQAQPKKAAAPTRAKAKNDAKGQDLLGNVKNLFDE